MDGRLEGKNVGVVFLGPANGSVRAEVEAALADAGADGGGPARVVALDVPVDPADVSAILEGDELLAGYADEGGDLSDLGRELGRQLAEGDDTLWGSLQSELIEEQSGSTSTPIDAAVVVTTWAPPEDADPDEAADAASEATASLLEGLVSGLDSVDIPVVGLAAGDDPEQALDAFRNRGISTVDDIDLTAGRLALALLLAGAQPGHYGFGDSATDGSVPPIEPLPVEGE
jgi:hypothetical protein